MTAKIQTLWTEEELVAYFDRIYSSDLRYIPDCYKLCGDAHCCNFSRYKQKFVFMGRTHFQELPLLPGEFEYLARRNYLNQFGSYDIRETNFHIAQGVVTYRAIVSRREGCACENAIRPTVCRLYPFYPQYDTSGGLVGIEDVGIYEELERIDRLPRACQITSVPISEVKGFVALATHIGSDPVAAFHMEAFRTAKAIAATAVEKSIAGSGKSAFRAFEALVMRSNLLDTAALRRQLEALADRFIERHGSDFQRRLCP